MRGIGEWGGYNVGGVVVATTPFEGRIGHSYLKRDSVLLPSGVVVHGTRGTHVGDYLSVGTLAVAIRHSGDYFHDYVPVNLSNDGETQRMVPFPDLRFGAYGFGETVGRLDDDQLSRIAAGLAIQYPERVSAPVSGLMVVAAEGI